ncbi:MAG: MATE family efflux transporter [Lachnospira sp.]|nr:MATE family efflux transporter [Lachnospira sp.]
MSWFRSAGGEKVKYTTQYDKMTKQPVGSLVITLGIPTTISMLVTNIYNMVDTMFVGKLGTSASGAVGIVFGFMSILQAFGFLFGQGAGSIISRRLGNKDEDSASVVASTAFFSSMFMGLLIGILGTVFNTKMVYLLGSTDTILPYAKTYSLFIMAAAPFMTSTFTMNNILRFEGKASLSMVGLMTGAILNMVGDPILMFGLDMGIAGAGLSTAISQFVSFCVLLSMFLSGKTQSKLSVRKITREFNVLFDIVATGFPSLVRQGLQAVSTMILNQQARIYGDAAVAAMSIVSRISFFIFAVGLGIGQGFQPVCGFNYGARKFSRVKEAFSFTLVAGEALLGMFAVAGLLFSNQAIAVFRDDAEVIAFGTPALRYQCMALFLNPLIVLSNMTLQSTGQRAWATFLSMMRSGLYLIPMIYILTYTMGARGIQLAQPVSDVLSFATTLPVIVNFIRKLPEDERETVCIDKV